MQKRSRSGWILFLGAITVGGLYYFGKENVYVTSALVQSEIDFTPGTTGDKRLDSNSASLTPQSKNEASVDKTVDEYADKNVGTIGRGSTLIENVNSVQKVVSENSLSLNEGMLDNDDGRDTDDPVNDSSAEMEATKIEEAAPGKEQANTVEATSEKEPTKIVRKSNNPDEAKTVIKEKEKKKQ